MTGMRALIFMGVLSLYFIVLWWSLQFFSFETLITIFDALNLKGVLDGIVVFIGLMVVFALILAAISFWLIFRILRMS